MIKGVKEFTRAKFMQMLPHRAEIGNTAFRKAVYLAVMDEFGVSNASACTQYNNVFKEIRREHPEMVVGLGRAPDKKGGRRPSVTVDVIERDTGLLVAASVSRNQARELIKDAVVAGGPVRVIRENHPTEDHATADVAEHTDQVEHEPVPHAADVTEVTTATVVTVDTESEHHPDAPVANTQSYTHVEPALL